MAQTLVDDKEATLDNPLYYPNIVNGQYTLSPVSPIRYLSQFIRSDTTAVMELGSGWGSNLFQLYLVRGATRSKRTIYYGGEYTREGQICSKFIATRDEHLKFRAFNFDFRAPDVTFLCRQKGHILLFTNHSIEQVDEINPDLFDQLREIANDVTVVHFEPIGWQRKVELVEKRENDDRSFFQDIATSVATFCLSCAVFKMKALSKWLPKNIILMVPPIFSTLRRCCTITLYANI